MYRFVGFAGWLAATVVATAISVGTISFVREDISDRTVAPLSPGEVDRAFARSSATPAAAAGPLPATVAGMTRAFSSPGGIVLAQCDGGAAFVRSWIPAQGFSYNELVRGPGPTASIEFDSDDGCVGVVITCREGIPTAVIDVEHYDEDSE